MEGGLDYILRVWLKRVVCGLGIKCKFLYVWEVDFEGVLGEAIAGEILGLV